MTHNGNFIERKLYAKAIAPRLVANTVFDVKRGKQIESVEHQGGMRYLMRFTDGAQEQISANEYISCVVQPRNTRSDLAAELAALLDDDPIEAGDLISNAVVHLAMVLSDSHVNAPVDDIPRLRETILTIKDWLEGRNAMSPLKLHEYIMKRHGDEIHHW